MLMEQSCAIKNLLIMLYIEVCDIAGRDLFSTHMHIKDMHDTL